MTNLLPKILTYIIMRQLTVLENRIFEKSKLGILSMFSLGRQMELNKEEERRQSRAMNCRSSGLMFLITCLNNTSVML